MYWPVGFVVYWWSGNLKEEKEGPKWEEMMINEIKEQEALSLRRMCAQFFFFNVFIAETIS